MLCPVFQCLEQNGVCSGEKTLCLKTIQRLKQGPSAVRIKVGSNFVEQEKRHNPGAQAHETRMGKDEPDKEGLLFPGRAQGGGHVLLRMDHFEIDPVWS